MKGYQQAVTIDTFVEPEGVDLDVNEVMSDHAATLGQLFTVCRQWNPKTQSKIADITSEFLCRGASPNDRDALTGDTLLHFACKAGALGFGCEPEASRAIMQLLEAGASPNTPSSWTGMSPLHTAAMFGFLQGLELLLNAPRRVNVNAKSSGLDGVTALHIAVQNRNVKCVSLLLSHGSNRMEKDSSGKTAYDYALEGYEAAASDNEREEYETIRQLLRDPPSPNKQQIDSTHQSALKRHGSLRSSKRTSSGQPHSSLSPKSRPTLTAASSVTMIEVGDRVSISGDRQGVVRYRGLVDFKPGRWLGIELDNPQGKHDGTVHGKAYFLCPDKHGVFVLADNAMLVSKSTANAPNIQDAQNQARRSMKKTRASLGRSANQQRPFKK
eukprot:gene7782-643_t